MKKNIYISLLSLVLLFSSTVIFAQNEIIEVNNTDIKMSGVYDFGTVTESCYTKYIVKNNRSSDVVVSKIKTPPGFFANISNSTIKPNKKAILYVGLDPKHVEDKGVFLKNIVIETNLVTDIKLELKGDIK